jgi:AmmeMemoRadiSam system protein B
MPTYPLEFRPTLRPGVRLAPTDDPDRVAVVDTSRLVPGGVVLTRGAASLLELFTGTFTLGELTEAFAALPDGVPADALRGVVSALDRALMLDSPAFAAYLAGPERLPACIGAYPGDPGELAATLDALFDAPGGPGRPAGPRDGPRLRALLVPHMDYARGNVTYAHGFRELAERVTATAFVVVATSHYSGHRFTLTRKDFTTPLGTVRTDQAAVDRLVNAYGDGLFDDPAAHLPEHSVELEVVWLQHLMRGRPFTIVPLLVGSFRDATAAGVSPGELPDIARMVDALRDLDAFLGDRGCFVVSGDLAHIGPKFRDPDPVTDSQLSACRVQDERLLAAIGAADPAAYAEVIAGEVDARRVCGYPPTWLTLSALKPSRGRVLHYQQYVDPAGRESVSFAAAAFDE